VWLATLFPCTIRALEGEQPLRVGPKVPKFIEVRTEGSSDMRRCRQVNCTKQRQICDTTARFFLFPTIDNLHISACHELCKANTSTRGLTTKRKTSALPKHRYFTIVQYKRDAANLGVLDGELENHLLVGEGLVHLGEGVQLGLNVDEVLGVQEDLEDLGAVNLISNSLADNLGRVYNVLQYRLVHSSEGSGHRAGALLESGSVESLREDGSLGDNHNVSATELLLKLADDSVLDLVEILQLAERHEDDDGLAATVKVELLSSGDVSAVELSLELGGGGLLQTIRNLGC